jgi:hypothetical protein
MVRAGRLWLAMGAFLLVAVGAAAVGLAITPAARADTAVQPYLDPAQEDPFWSLVTGQLVPDTFPASWAAKPMVDVEVGAGALPPLGALGTLSLAAGSFALGWEIGRQIDNRWLRLSGDIGTTMPSTASYHVADRRPDRRLRPGDDLPECRDSRSGRSRRRSAGVPGPACNHEELERMSRPEPKLGRRARRESGRTTDLRRCMGVLLGQPDGVQ